MAFNIQANKPCAAIALKDATFAEMGLSSQNIYIIYIADNPPTAWNPTRAINGMSGVIKGQGYFIYAKVDIDVTAYFAPPLTDAQMLKDWVMQNCAELLHTHTVEQIEGLQEALDNAVAGSHTHQIADVNGLQAALDAAGQVYAAGTGISIVNNVISATGTASNVTWENITDKPLSFAPSSHSHDWNDILGKPTTFTPSAHTHTWTEITNKPTVFTPAAHIHAIADVTGLQTALNGKASTSHVHAASDITSGVFASARLGIGTADSTKYLAGDGTWKTYTGGTGSGSGSGLFVTDLSSNIYMPSITGNPTVTVGTVKNNILMGFGAGLNTTEQHKSIIIGYDTGRDANNLAYSVIIGEEAGKGADDIHNSAVIGWNAAINAVNIGDSNVIGPYAGHDADHVVASNLLGSSAGASSREIWSSDFIGASAGANATFANDATFIGSCAGTFTKNAKNAIFIGRYAGSENDLDTAGITTGRINNTTQDYSILIGKFTKTGGFKNSILLGGSVVNETYIANTKHNQFMLAPNIINARFRDIDYVFPSAQGGANTVLSNDGTGVLSWITVEGGNGTGQTFTSTSGLTISGSELKLGGTLTSDALITSNGFKVKTDGNLEVGGSLTLTGFASASTRLLTVDTAGKFGVTQMISVNASNGLSLGSGGSTNIQLGGTLSKVTTINFNSASGYGLKLSNVTTVAGQPYVMMLGADDLITKVAASTFITSETDPVFVASPAYGITNTNIGEWQAAYIWGNHANAGYATQGELTTYLSVQAAYDYYVLKTDAAATYATLSHTHNYTLSDITANGHTTSTDIEITDYTKGAILRSSDGSRWRVTINNAGALASTKL